MPRTKFRSRIVRSTQQLVDIDTKRLKKERFDKLAKEARRKARLTGAGARRKAILKAGTKFGAKKILGRAIPVVGAVIGAREIVKAAPKLARGIPKLLKERGAARNSKIALNRLQQRLARRKRRR